MAKRKTKSARRELIIITDRSGSMSRIASDMEGALKKLLEDQEKENLFVTYVRFDDVYEEVFFEKPAKDVKKIPIQPRNMTALLDAIGKTLNTVERRSSEKEKKDRADKVLFVIVTDGLENASREFSRAQVFEMIEKAKRDNKWDFMFIGANQDSIAEGASLGIARGSSLNYAASAKGVRGMSHAVSSYTSAYFAGDAAEFSDEDRAAAMDE